MEQENAADVHHEIFKKKAYFNHYIDVVKNNETIDLSVAESRNSFKDCFNLKKRIQ